MSKYPKINAHIHTPYSFSAFESIEEAVSLAHNEEIKVLGINDFNTTAGYEEFNAECQKKGIIPLFNIEFIGLHKEFQEKGIRINDPNNPGRIYLSGKGLKYPVSLNNVSEEKVKRVQDQSNHQIKLMVDKLNEYFKSADIAISLNFEDIKTRLTKGLFRERHLAKAIRLALFEKKHDNLEFAYLCKKILPAKFHEMDPNDTNAFENDIRSSLLKSGGHAFVPEDDTAFLSIPEIKEIIINAGGIPCYPVLLDDNKGNYTDFEEDWELMHHELQKLQISCIELIPGRNSLEVLESFVRFFRHKNYVILFGTEHNTPEMVPLAVSCRNSAPLTEELLKVSFEGACVIAAHQKAISEGLVGFIDALGNADKENLNHWITKGAEIIGYKE